LIDGVIKLSGREWSLPAAAAAILLLIVAVTVGPALGAAFRPLFVLGCVAAGWYTWRSDPGSHLQAALFLFAFAPLARRMVDLSAGYDSAGLMLVGPMLAILVPIPSLWGLLEGKTVGDSRIAPNLIVAGCVTYAAALSLFQGNLFDAASGVLKWMAPLLYAASLAQCSDRDRMVQAAASAFLLILPVTGVMGVLQYVDPPAWDRYWMQFAPILSVGQPLPFEVRVFSTMNGPASFATFTATGILLVCFLRLRWYSLLCLMPAALALLLSLYRTAWLSLAIGVIFCFLFASTRRQSAVLTLGALAAIAAAATVGPFADAIGDRLATLGAGAEDGSARERLEQYLTLWNLPDSSLLGVGFSTSDVGSAGAMATDGTIISAWLAMGIVIGLICLFALLWAALRMVTSSWQGGGREAVVIGAIGCGSLLQLPLANIASGELGFLFWTFAMLAAVGPRRHGNAGAP
jgi:hypothetical protein